ncbi:uncharacterized protein LOC113774198 [Coffea eugenioides]|uniref:uncharacterized protein LOC113774198 n=1 Tax=Coffea eugenioides TaxID=49369 RepID=UPI000F613206|nr:uncharacterized protein LOC113774198 [Coffea eugenioides]
MVETSIPKGITSTLIVLIPKKPNPSMFADFRPISLCTFVNKIFTKVLANRLRAILPGIISQEQSAFCPGRDIAENVLLAQEMVASINRKGLNARVVDGSVAHYAMPRGCVRVTHLAFADDIVIFARGDRRSVGNLIRFLMLYQTGAGQRINKQKSFFLMSRWCGAGQIRQIQHLTGFRHGSFPFPYLGCNFYAGHRKKEFFHFLIEKFVAKLAGWQKKLLSQGGRLILIKHVLSAISLHVLAVMDPPKQVLKSLERVMAKFLWGQSDFGSKHHWCSWKNLCYPIFEDGLGIRGFEDMQGAFSCKLWW